MVISYNWIIHSGNFSPKNVRILSVKLMKVHCFFNIISSMKHCLYAATWQFFFIIKGQNQTNKLIILVNLH